MVLYFVFIVKWLSGLACAVLYDGIRCGLLSAAYPMLTRKGEAADLGRGVVQKTAEKASDNEESKGEQPSEPSELFFSFYYQITMRERPSVHSRSLWGFKRPQGKGVECRK